MATLTKVNEFKVASFFSQVEKVREEIKTKFARVRQALDVREYDLLSELQKLEVWYRGKGIADQIEELNQLKEVQLVTTKLNENKDLVMKHVAELDVRIKKLEDEFVQERNVRSIVLEWDEKFESKLSELGKIRLKPIPDYKEVERPEFTAFKHIMEQSGTPGVFHCPRSIAIHPETGDVYVCDCGNDRVQVFNKAFQFLFCFCEEMHGPDGICISEGRVYITQNWDHCLNVYNSQGKFFNSVGKEKKSFKLFSTTIKFESPRGVAVSTETNIIYVCDTGYNRIQSLNLDLTYNSMITDIPKPRDIKLTSEELVVLTEGEYCIYLFNFSQQLFKKIIPRGEHVKYPWHFCLDIECNFLITDLSSCCVAIFTNKGDLIHKFGKKGDEKGEFKEPTGIAIDSQHRIIVVSENPENCLQMF